LSATPRDGLPSNPREVPQGFRQHVTARKPIYEKTDNGAKSAIIEKPLVKEPIYEKPIYEKTNNPAESGIIEKPLVTVKEAAEAIGMSRPAFLLPLRWLHRRGVCLRWTARLLRLVLREFLHVLAFEHQHARTDAPARQVSVGVIPADLMRRDAKNFRRVHSSDFFVSVHAVSISDAVQTIKKLKMSDMENIFQSALASIYFTVYTYLRDANNIYHKRKAKTMETAITIIGTLFGCFLFGFAVEFIKGRISK
jgi:hypothetical protein